MGANNQNYRTTSEWVQWAKSELNIDKPNPDLNDDEIQQVLRLLGTVTRDPVIDTNGKFCISRNGIGVLLLIAIAEFPRYFEKSGLALQN